MDQGENKGVASGREQGGWIRERARGFDQGEGAKRERMGGRRKKWGPRGKNGMRTWGKMGTRMEKLAFTSSRQAHITTNGKCKSPLHKNSTLSDTQAQRL